MRLLLMWAGRIAAALLGVLAMLLGVGIAGAHLYFAVMSPSDLFRVSATTFVPSALYLALGTVFLYAAWRLRPGGDAKKA